MAPAEVIETKASMYDLKHSTGDLSGPKIEVNPGGTVEFFNHGVRGTVSCDSKNRSTKVKLEKRVALKKLNSHEPEDAKLELEEILEDGQFIAVPISQEKTLVVRHRGREI